MKPTISWLQQTISAMESQRDEVPFGISDDHDMTLEAFKLALAGMEVDPVIIVGDDGGDALAYRRLIQSFEPGTKLYTAPQPITTSERAELENYRNAHQVVPEWTNEQCLEFLSIAFRHAEIKGDLEMDDIRLGVKMVNACRAAMPQELQKSAGVSNNCRSNENVQDLQAGNSPVIPDGLRLALSNAGIAAPESDEMLAATCEKYIQALVTWVKDRKPFKSAVLPDGYVMLPAEPTHAMMNAWLSEVANWRGHAAGYRAMIAAAPQQEVK